MKVPSVLNAHHQAEHVTTIDLNELNELVTLNPTPPNMNSESRSDLDNNCSIGDLDDLINAVAQENNNRPSLQDVRAKVAYKRKGCNPSKHHFEKAQVKFKQQIADEVKKSKWDFSHLKTNKYMLDKPTAPSIASSKQGKKPTYKNKILNDVENLTKPPLCPSTIRNHKMHHILFNNAMKELDEEEVPTVHRAVMLITHMFKKKYSVHYIGTVVSSLKYHPDLKDDLHRFTHHPDIRNALANLKKECFQKEDNRIPITHALITELSKIADRDFTPKTALCIKAAMWVSFTAMLRAAEGIYKPDTGRTITTDKLVLTDRAFTITFTGWKLQNKIKSIEYPYVKGTEEEAAQAICRYLKACPAIAKTKENALFVNDNGDALDRHTLELLWHHLVDHSTYKGLHITLHSMRIGGATARHRQSTELKEIARLGRWTDNTIEGYIRPELLLPPEKLREIGTYHTKRSYECHLSCDCVITNDQGHFISAPKHTKQPKFHKRGYANASDRSKIIRIFASRHREQKKKEKAQVQIPYKIREAERLMRAKIVAQPLSRPYTIDSTYLKKKFKNDQRLFNFTLYMASKCWQ